MFGESENLAVFLVSTTKLIGSEALSLLAQVARAVPGAAGTVKVFVIILSLLLIVGIAYLVKQILTISHQHKSFSWRDFLGSKKEK